jgi:hypothetical protein
MRAAALGALGLLLVAGCSSPPADARFRAQASGAVAFQGYDYAGKTAERGNGSAVVAVDAAADRGTASFTFEALGKAWRADVREFRGEAGYQEGGVRSGFPERGGSGNGDGLLPLLHALNAGWGAGSLEADGQPFADPASGTLSFALHYTVTDTAPRNLTTLAVTRANGRTPYDPRQPDDARTLPMLQLLLDVRSPGGPWPADNATRRTDTALGTEYNRTFPFGVLAESAQLRVNVTVSQPPPAPGPGALTFNLTDPAGSLVESWQFAPLVAEPVGAARHSFLVPSPLQVGVYHLAVRGTAANLEYRVDALVDYPDPVFLHVVYGSVALG